MTIPAKYIDEHFENNLRWWEAKGKALASLSLGYLECQDHMSDVYYGLHNNLLSRLFLQGRPLRGIENTCEIIALYNAFHYLKSDIPFPELIRSFENRGIWLKGYWGTKPHALCSFLKEKGYDYTVLRGKAITPTNISLCEHTGPCILVTMNHRFNIWKMIHTVCITPTATGFKSHNDFEGNKTYSSLADAVLKYHNAKGRPLMFINIKVR